ncbi:hypothetical protein ACMC5R_05985 [Deferribacteres bacterium DY0037]|nr:hypothetical protein [Denitrovibrio acetiphilus]
MKLLGSYSILLLLGVICALLSVQLIVMQGVRDELKQASTEVMREKRGLRSGETHKLLIKLEKIMKDSEFPAYRRENARGHLLETVEEFRSAYGAKVLTSVQEEGSSLIIDIQFKYLPASPEDLISLLQYLKNSISPIYQVTKAEFVEDKNKRTADIRLKLIQPFSGGDYVF